MDKINILGVNISNISKEKILEKINFFLENNNFHFITTPNPEIILEALKDKEELVILNNADIAIADGFGIIIAGLFLGKKIKRTTGADLTVDLLNIVEKKGYKLAIINWRGGLSKKEKIINTLNFTYPNLKFKVFDAARDFRKFDSTDFDNYKPEMVFVCLGAPYQEKFIYNVLKNKSFVKLAIGVGGSFDYLTLSAARAPKILRFLGMEWFWRLLIQPNRIGRIWNATFVFMGKFLIWKYVKS